MLLATIVLLCASAAVRPSRAAPIVIEFDFTLDSQNFFSTQEKRDALELAGYMIGQRLGDDLEAILPAGVNGFDAIFSHPETGAQQQVNDFPVPADTVVIFVGGRNFGAGGSLGFGGNGGFSAFGSSSWLTTVRTRGETGVDQIPPTDVGPWGGSISFNSNAAVSWHFGATNAGLGPVDSDFLSVALHEVGHVLGIGTAASWDALVSGSSFTGPVSVAEYDLAGNVPLDGDLSHWANGTSDGGNETAMDPSLTTGTRKLFTELDFAALDDIGWDILPPPIPGDGNGDGSVDPADYTIWANNFGQTGVGTPGDYNLNLVVDVADYTTWANNFGAVAPSPLAAVPEPSSFALSLAALLSMVLAARRIKRSA